MNVILLSLLAVACAADDRLVTMYETPYQESLPENSEGVVYAYINCAKNTGQKMVVCAELPKNWRWAPGAGYVALDVFSNRSMTGTPVCSTGSVDGTVVPSKCCEINSWPGGDLFIKVSSNNHNPVIYTVSAVLGDSAGYREKRTINSAIPKTKSVRKSSGTTQQILMYPVLKTRRTMSITYTNEMDSYKELELDLCLNEYVSKTFKSMRLAVIGMGSGAYSYYVCTRPDCLPNQRHTVASQPADHVISVIEIPVSQISKAEQLFVRIYAHTGDKDSNGNYVAHFIMGLSFY